MLNIKTEQAYFTDHIKTLGVVKVNWNQNGSIRSIQRETHCIFRLDQIVILWDTWIKAKSSGIVLCENDIETAIAIEGTAVKKIISHVEQTIIQKALVFSNGNQRLAADQIGMSRTKLGHRIKVIRSSGVRATA